MLADFQTQIAGINLDTRRTLKMLPSTLQFEVRNPDGSFTEIGSITDGWCADEVQGETFGGPAVEYQFLMVWASERDTLCKTCTAVKMAGTRYEKRAVDPAVGSPAIIRLRAQTITGYARI